MKGRTRRWPRVGSSDGAKAAALLLTITCVSCGGTARAAAGDGAPTEAAMRAMAERNRPDANSADVRFMTNMIPHHGQAVLFAGWAESHGAGRAVRVLCERMVVAQRDEIVTMRDWLRAHGQPVPPAEYRRMPMGGPGHVMMPGMLTEEQLAELDAARGSEFDRLFLTYMIPHHEGALLMVDELFTSYGGAQDDVVFKLASDIYADQTTEIERMERMLSAMSPGAPHP